MPAGDPNTWLILPHEEYEDLVRPLTEELSAMARWVDETGQRIVVLFEGRDTAGKGGSIDMIARVLNPRQCHVVALSSPSERERSQWYFQRYAAHLPAEGRNLLVRPQLVQPRRRRAGDGLLLRSRDGRLPAAPCPSSSGSWWRTASCCSNTGCAATRKKQEKRFENRLHNPLKRWKLSPIDIEARTKYDAYTDAREKMLRATHTDFAPWTLVDFNDQALGRLTLLRDLLDRVPDTELPLKEIPLASAARDAKQGKVRSASAHSQLRDVT